MTVEFFMTIQIESEEQYFHVAHPTVHKIFSQKISQTDKLAFFCWVRSMLINSVHWLA